MAKCIRSDLALLAVGVSCVALWACSSDSSTSSDASSSYPDADMAVDVGGDSGAPADVDAGGANTSILIDAESLSAMLEEPGVVVLDARAEGEFLAGHVPGAQNLPIGRLSATVDGVAGQVASPDVVAAALTEAGVDRDSTVVTYGNDSGLLSSRLLWVLELHGHPDVTRLDGGFPAWSGTAHPIETGSAPGAAGDYPIPSIDEGRRADADFILAHLDDPNVHIIDVRTESEYTTGHIPGARHIEWSQAIDGTGLMRPVNELADLYRDIPRQGTVVTYCTTGVRGSMGYFTLRLLGYPDVRLYDGSWSEWGSRPELPREP